MKIVIGSDHNGFEYKQSIIAFLEKAGHEVVDVSGDTLDPEDDFPIHASRVAHEVIGTHTDSVRGILLCGSGQGVCMAANRFKGIRAALCWNLDEARAARNDGDSNVLCLAASDGSLQKEEAIITTWLNAPFAGAARYKRRIKQLDELTP